MNDEFLLSRARVACARHPFGDRDWLVGAALAAAAMLSRLPFVATVLYHWDSVNFARAIERFDVAAGQPHVPGYILYVALTRLVNGVAGDARGTLVGISIAGSGLSVAALYALGRAMFDRTAAVTAALLLASSPLFWFYGEIGLPHPLDAFAVIAAVWLLYRVVRGEVRMLLPAAVWLGIAGGLRPQTQVFLAPLALYAAWHAPLRSRFVALVALALVDLAWFVPLVELSGGLSRYLAVTSAFTAEFNTTTAIVTGGLWGLRRNAVKLGMYTLYAWSFGGLPVALVLPLLWSQLRHGGRRVLGDQRAWCLALWVVPVVAYYLLVHMGQQGLVFVFLPALCLLSGAGVSLLGRARPHVVPVATLALVAGNGALFLLAPTYPLGGDRPKLLTVDTLRRHDASYLARTAAVRRLFAPQHTVIVSAAWRFPEYYLPEYRLLRYDIVARWERGEGQPKHAGGAWIVPEDLGIVPGADGFTAVILFDDHVIPFAPLAAVEWIALPNGERLAWMRLGPHERVHLDPRSPSSAAAGADAP
jgi:4-amino-4-deoxy-L-arabinose transferase-like glycosyltransferase